MSLRKFKRTCGTLLVCAAALLADSASAAVLSDNFNDNARDTTLWFGFNAVTTKFKETTKRLCFQSTSDTNGPKYAGFASNNWTYRGQNNATFSFDYKVDVAGLTGSESAAVGVYTIEPDEATALEVRVIQKASGRFVQLELYIDNNSVEVRSAPVANATGHVEVVYTKSTDVMVVKVDGVTKITFNDLNGDYGPFDLEVELFGTTKKTSCAYADLWMDNFKLIGTIDN